MTLIKTLIFAGFSLAVGLVFGNELRRRRSAEDQVDELRAQLKHARGPLPERQLKEIRGVLNDAHKHIVAVTKALEKQAS
jgi:hypothetical protein